METHHQGDQNVFAQRYLIIDRLSVHQIYVSFHLCGTIKRKEESSNSFSQDRINVI